MFLKFKRQILAPTTRYILLFIGYIKCLYQLAYFFTTSDSGLVITGNNMNVTVNSSSMRELLLFLFLCIYFYPTIHCFLLYICSVLLPFCIYAKHLWSVNFYITIYLTDQ